MQKWFDILELEIGATAEEIKQSYRDLVRVWHPDRFVDNTLKLKAEEKLKLINEAYEKLKFKTDSNIETKFSYNPNSYTSEKSKKASYSIISGVGSGIIAIGNKQDLIDQELGFGLAGSRYSNVYFINYLNKGIQISFRAADQRAHAVFYYNKDEGYEHFATASVITEKGIHWDSSLDEVTEKYGNPILNFSGFYTNSNKWQRISFIGIDFRFINNKLVRISVPGR